MGKALTQEEAEQRIINNYKYQQVRLISKYINKRESIILHCLDCGHIWETKGNNALYVDKATVSRQCINCGDTTHGRRNGTMLECAYCNAPVYRTPSRIEANKTGLFYCSRKCGNLHKNQMRSESGEWKDTANYRRLAFENYPHECHVCKWKEDIRILEVHHIDSDRANNILENLVILCPTCHRKITLQYYQLEGASLIKIR